MGVYPWLAFSSLALALGGCAHADTVADRQIAEMRETIGKVQADQDQSSDKDFAEMARDGEAKDGELSGTKVPGAKRTTPAPPPPTQRTVQLGQEDDDAQSDDPDAPTARPEIRLEGNHVATPRSGSRSRARRSDDDALRPAASGASGASGPSGGSADASRPSVLDPEAKRAYEDAHALVDAKRYDRALEALTAFLTRYPDHPYAENATYWKGECYFAKGDYLRAAEQFEAVLTHYSGNKAPDALLKMGMAHDRLGAPDRARAYWERLRRDYPRSDAARRIPSKNEARGSSSAAGPKEDISR
jgi:tol-pal system protein YbgF